MARGDGKLTHDLLDDDKGPQDACGVFGVWAPGEQVAKLTYFGLYALQHRGQEAAGIAVSDGSSLVVYKDLGLVSQVFDEATLATLQGHIAVGHTRYSTTGSDHLGERAAQLPHHPDRHRARAGPQRQPRQHRRARRRRRARPGISDAEQRPGRDHRLRPADRPARRPPRRLARAGRDARCCPSCSGAFSLVFMDEHTLYAARDPQGVRPLVLGRLERGWVVTSETAALDIVGASFVREIEPGELIAIDEDGLRSQHFAAAEPEGLPVRVRLPRPAGHHDRRPQRALDARRGRPAAGQGAPGRGRPGDPGARVGHARRDRVRRGSPASPTALGLVKNAYVGRTFIQPSQTIRQLGIRLKLNPLRDVIRGKRLVVVDDSIVRGNTQRALVRMLREAGALEVHVRISSPPVKWPCFYGIDFASKAELVANGLDVDGIRALDRRRLAGLRLPRRAGRSERAAAQPAVQRLLRRPVPDPAARRSSASTCSKASSGQLSDSGSQGSR